MKIRGIEHGMGRPTLTTEVVDKARQKLLKLVWEAETALAVVKDETGTISLKLWRDQVDMIKPSDMIQILNGLQYFTRVG